MVPNWGGSQVNGSDDAASCANHHGDVGSIGNSSDANDANIALYCSWADRIVVPLSFAPPRAFLSGTPDKWGMHVNTYYKNVSWPTDNIQSLDPVSDSKQYPGWGTMQVVSNPVNGLDNVVTSLLASRPTATNTTQPTSGTSGCSLASCSYGRFSSEPAGQRVLFAVMDAADAANYGFSTAALVNYAGKAVSSAARPSRTASGTPRPTPMA